MKSEYVALSIIGGMGLIVAVAYQMPAKVLKVDKQGSSSASNGIQEAVQSAKSSINSIASSSPIKLGKSKSSSLSFGGSKRNKRGGKTKRRK